ncbi:MAG TPA: addiction module protein [Pirellulales bacterium]|nr:addiction module protein [Pirellulales bacterium]
MMPSIADIDFSTLSADECILLAQQLWDRVYDETQAIPMPAEQRAEIERRLAAVNDGTMPVYPWEDVRRRLLNRH